jgi:hypothetical protein
MGTHGVEERIVEQLDTPEAVRNVWCDRLLCVASA